MEAGKQIRGKDLVGGVMVMPMGLGDAIKKRTSGEFKMEQKGSSMSFSQTQASASGQSQSSSMSSSSRQLGTFQEETNESFGSQMQKSSFKTSSSMQSSAMSSSHESSSMTMSSSKSMSSSLSSKTVASSFQESHSQLNKMELSQSQENQEIKQDKLKTQIVSAITDLEGDRDLVDFSKENRTIDLMSPAQAKSPTPKSTFTPTKQDPFSPAKQDLFSPPPLEQVFEQPQPEPQLPMSNGASHAEPLAMAPPSRNGLQNGFNEFVSTKDDQSSLYNLRRPRQFKGRAESRPRPLSMPVDLSAVATLDLPDISNMPRQAQTIQESIEEGEEESQMSMEMQQIQEFTQSTTSTSRVNGAYEEIGTLQESGGSNPMLQKIMTPASMEYDTGSLKKKDPKKMFTDSSFYNSKYHPTIADQVEMAHKLSSAMFNEQNKGTKGAKMYLTRMENSGGFGDDTPKHDNVPNMKLVMNPEGKVHVWDDLPPEQRPDMGQLATHAAPNLSLPDVADPVAESLQAGVGRGEKSFYRPSTFVSAYRQVFDQNRGVFGSQAQLKSPESPAPPRHKHASSTNVLTKSTDNRMQECKSVKLPESPLQSPKVVPKRLTVLESPKSRPIDSEPKRQVSLKRHKSFTEDSKTGLDQRKTKYFAEPQPTVGLIKPADVLRTPYLLPSVSTLNQGNFNNFPQITSTSMVSKTKALFEGKEEQNDSFLPLGKSRTFSCFPSLPSAEDERVSGACPLTPSVPKRKSSRSVIAGYKSVASSINSCGMEAENERRIPMRNFF